MKAPRGCENLKAQAVGRGRPDHHAAAPCEEDAEGVKTSREALQNGVRLRLGVWIRGKLWVLCGGSVLGCPLKRSRSP